MKRVLYLVCYDISNSRRRRQIHKCVKAYSIGGQKSCMECLMSIAERKKLLVELFDLINENEDRIHIFYLDPRMMTMFSGKAKRQSTQPFLIV